MATKLYTHIRVDREALASLKDRITKINQIDLKKLGVKNKKINQIDLTRFLFNNKIYISDNELLNMVKKNRRGRLC